MSTATPKHRCHTMVQPAFPCEEFNDAPSAGRRREANLLQDTETSGRTACGRPRVWKRRRPPKALSSPAAVRTGTAPSGLRWSDGFSAPVAQPDRAAAF